MIHLYRLIAYLVYLGTYPYGRTRAAKDPLWAGRLATENLNPCDIWVHAASVGEVRVINHLIDYLKRREPKLTFHLTVMTRTGYATARQICGSSVAVSFLPFDVPLLWRRVLKQLVPRIVIVAETEIWPNLISELRGAKVPLVLVNGRMSAKAFERYLALKGSFQPLLSSYDHLFVKGQEDLERFLRIGVASDLMTLAGDMKFDAPLLERTTDQRRALRQSHGVADEHFLFVAGSTRNGEEPMLLEAYCRLMPQFPQLRLILVPRHIERAGEVLEAIRAAGLTGAVASGEARVAERTVLVVDKMGILNDLYAAADLAFVGGTLVDVGGHNLLEPVWAGTPVLFGPSIKNVGDAADYIVRHRLGAMVQDVDALIAATRVQLEGNDRFARKTTADLEHSATAAAGNYVRSRIRHA